MGRNRNCYHGRDAPTRFMRYINKTESCWEWTGGATGRGYGAFRVSHERRNVQVHRYAYELFVGEIPAGTTIHHICGNKLCVNPNHLKVLPMGEHIRMHRVAEHLERYLKQKENSMPSIKIPKESLEGPKKIPPGIYSVRMDGFEPAYSKAGDSINLQPILVVVNNPDYHNRRAAKEWLNTHGGWAITDFCHAFGQQLQGPADDPEIPGEFLNMDKKDPKDWSYRGPLLGKVGQVELAENTVDGKGPFINVKRYLCAIPGCKVRHSDNLLR